MSMAVVIFPAKTKPPAKVRWFWFIYGSSIVISKMLSCQVDKKVKSIKNCAKLIKNFHGDYIVISKMLSCQVDKESCQVDKIIR